MSVQAAGLRTHPVATRLLDTVERFSAVRALVVGDALIDHYHFGRIDRISPEAPVPIFVEDYSKAEIRRGGADNVAHQLEALGCQVCTAFALRRSIKHRYMVGHYQVFRVDKDHYETPHESFEVSLHDVDVVVLSDYAKGFLTPALCQDVIETAKAKNIPVVVDPKGTDWSKYSDATVLCPNQREFEAWNKLMPPAQIVLKRGEHGLSVIEYCEGENGYRACCDVPAQARHVYDVTGAGDVVVAVVAAALGVGCGLRDAARLATFAAGYAVGEVGTTVCPKEKLIELVR